MLQENQYHVIHAHFGHAALVARLQFSVPLVITYHGSDLLGICGADGRYTLKGKLASSLNRALSLTAKGVIVVARHLGERLPRQDWHLIPLGVDLERFAVLDKGEARNQLGWAQEPFIVLFAALNTSTPVKRFPLAKAALQLLQTKVHAELKVAEGIPPEMMPIYMNAADALLLTSAHEGSPTVVKEALACDLPVVATDVGDVRERLEGVTLSSVCEADPAALAAALEQIAAAKPRRSNGRKKIEHLSEPFVAERVADVYRSVLGNH